MKNVVIIGGGTGLSVLTRALSNINSLSITSVVSVADNGGSTGVLRDDFNIPAVGDIRRVIGAMADQDDLMVKLLEHRFDERNKGLKGHSLGNLLLTALIEMTGSLSKSVKWLSKYMNCNGEVYSVSDECLTLCAKYTDGSESEGEVSLMKNQHKKIAEVYYKEKTAAVNPHVLLAIEEADVILFGVGSLYSSIIPNLLFPKMQKAIEKSVAVKCYISNLMEEPGETIGYGVQQHVDALEKYIGKDNIDKVIFNNAEFPISILKKYTDVGQNPVKNDLKDQSKIVYGELVSTPNSVIRHSEEGIADTIVKVL